MVALCFINSMLLGFPVLQQFRPTIISSLLYVRSSVQLTRLSINMLLSYLWIVL